MLREISRNAKLAAFLTVAVAFHVMIQKGVSHGELDAGVDGVYFIQEFVNSLNRSTTKHSDVIRNLLNILMRNTD